MNSNHDPEDAPDRRLLWRLVGAAGLLAVALLVVWWPGCRQYPAATSKESMQLIKLVYSACNTKDPARLAKAEQGVQEAARAGKLSPPEQEAFAKILGKARAGDWEEAERAAFKFAQDQVGVGHPDPNPHDHGQDHKPGKGLKGQGK